MTKAQGTVSETQIRRAADALRERMSLHLGELADELLGRPEFGTPEWKADREQQHTPEGQAKLIMWHLTKIRICREAAVDPVGDVINARKLGATWEQIGTVCGISRQAAYDRWGKFA